MQSELNGEDFLLNLCRNARLSCEFAAQTSDELVLWQKKTAAVIGDALGINKIPQGEGKPELVESVSLAGCRRDKYILPTAAFLKMPLYVLVPNNCNGRSVIALHGHGCYGKDGITGNLPKEIPLKDSNNVNMGLELAQRGYIAVCPDILGSGERAEGLVKDKSKSACDILASTLSALGLSFWGVELFELMGACRFALNLKENKHDKAAVCGFSGGGFMSLLLTALCGDVDMGIVSGYFHTFADTCLQSNKCGCNFVHNMWQTADCGELAALAAPKPLYIECGKADKLHGRSELESVYKQYEKAKKAYKLVGLGNNIELELNDGGHKWYGGCYDFIKKHTGGN